MIEDKIFSTIKKYNLINENDIVVCGVSGGPDSMCMLDNLRKIKESNKLSFEIVVCHLNHLIREEAILDEEYVINYCKKNNIEVDEIEKAISDISTAIDNLVDILKTKNPTKKIEVRKTICEATRIRQKETENISKNVDLMIIIGGKKSSNTTKLYEISKNNCQKVYFVQNCDEVENIDFNGVEKVGIMAGASTPDEDIKDVVNKIKFKERN